MSAGIQLGHPTLSLLRTGDVVVVGGSFAGVAAALTFARAGRQVVLVEPRTYLGREITATLRPWVNADGIDHLPELIAACISATGTSACSGEIPLKLDAVKLCLEDMLLAAGVDLIYASLPVDVLTRADTVDGLVIGNKSGRQAIACKMMVDATGTAALARVAGATFEPENHEMLRFSRTLEFDHVQPLQDASLSVPERIGIVGNSIALHCGYRGEGHVLVECQMDLCCGGMDVAGSTRREIEARHRTMGLASHLISHVPAFQYALFAAASLELHGPHTSRMADPPPGWAWEFDSVCLSLVGRGREVTHVPLSAFAGPVRHLWCLQEAVRLESGQRPHLRHPVFASLAGTALAESIIDEWDGAASIQASAQRTPTPSIQLLRTDVGEAELKVKEPESPQRGHPYERRSVPLREVPVLQNADVLVVGGGTSGAMAAITSAREGMHTVLVEMNPGLGGTGTFGGVDSYWFGRRLSFSAQVAQWVKEVHDSLDYEGRHWNIEAKQYALLKQAEQAGVEMVFNAVVVGAIVQENKVRGVVIATRFGLFAVLAEVVIDATGDGDVAAFAGADHVYGSARDHVVMWYSLAQFTRPGRTQNNFTSMVDVSNVEDYVRAILAGRRRGGECHDHGIYVAPRESRHIMGDVVLTLTDQLTHRCWPDVVNIHFSNHDIKGHSGSDWIRLGLIPPNLEVEIPYRSLLPRGLEQILVVGKAISATHDALPAIRMQSDLENLGGVAGLAAAKAVREGIAPRYINVTDLQRALVDVGLLPGETITRTLAPRHVSDAELETLVDSLVADRPLYAYSDMEMDQVFRQRIPLVDVCTAGPRIVPVLEQALASAAGARRVRIAQALAMLESCAGVATLIAEIERLLAGGKLPAQESTIRHAQLPPDQGAMPDAVYLLYALGMARDRRCLAIWERVVELLHPTQESIRDRFKGIFYYVDAVCFGAERLGDPTAIRILEKLHACAPLRDQVARGGFQPDFFYERQAMLELAIGRALARCGSPRGMAILVAYVEDNRALLAEQAHTKLMAISGQDYGKDSRAWNDWFEGQVYPTPVILSP